MFRPPPKLNGLTRGQCDRLSCDHGIAVDVCDCQRACRVVDVIVQHIDFLGNSVLHCHLIVQRHKLGLHGIRRDQQV